MNELIKLAKGETPKEAVFKQEKVFLNDPVKDDDGFLVYALNSNNVVTKVRFELPNVDDTDGLRCSLQKDKSTPAYWMCKLLSDVEVQDHSFETFAVMDAESKTLTSVRDGVQEYYGIELGIEPKDKVFSIYRSPETISAITGMMDNLPVIEDHININSEPTKKQTIGLITDTEVISCIDSGIDSTMMISNKVKIGDEAMKVIANGKKQLSLGYLAKIKPHATYDFEQHCIVPKHLAIVNTARGGSGLTFKDGIKLMDEKLKEFFASEEFSLDGLKGLLMMIKEELDAKESDEYKEISADLDKALSKTGSEGSEDMEDSESEETMEDSEDKETMEDSEGSEEDVEAKDSEEDVEVEVEDSEAKEAKEAKEEVINTQDADFIDAVNVVVKKHMAVIKKAQTILPETFNFEDKSPNELIRECLKEAGYKEEFEDSDLDIAFKMIKDTKDKYNNFGDKTTKYNWKKEI